MSITSIMGTGLSALSANQAALKATSTNVANVNTEGYSRLDVQFQTQHALGRLHGVQIDVQRVANAFLAAAEMRSASDVAAADVLAQFMDRAQGLLGDPTQPGSAFSNVDPVIEAFGALSTDPASALRQSSVISELQTLLSQLDMTQNEIQNLRAEAHTRGTALMEEANSLMHAIAGLNESIQRATIGGGSAPEAETQQGLLIDRLSEILDIRVHNRDLGGVEVRTADGLLLVDLNSARLAYDSTSDGEPYPGVVMIAAGATVETPMATHLNGGELLGLMRARDDELVNLGLAFGEYAGGVVEALNAAHNAGSALNPPATLTGRNTGLLTTDTLNFSGQTNIAITDSDGLVVRNYRVDFSAGPPGTITDDLGNVQTFANSVGDFQTALNASLTANTAGTATFTNGVLQIDSTIANSGLVITEDPTNPSGRVGRGFSHTFGLNDIVAKEAPVQYATGLTGTDLHNFGAGETITFAMRDENGGILRTTQMTINAGTNMTALVGDINTALTGYGQASLDATTGRLTLSSLNGEVSRVDVIADTTERGSTGLSFSQMFGVGEEFPTGRSNNLKVVDRILANPSQISTAKADLVGTIVGTRVLSSGDSRGALELEAVGARVIQFGDAGGLAGQGASISDYAARLAGHAALRSQALDSARTAAESIRTEVSNRRQSEEGVNLDEELVKMTTYQQSYAAASRLIQAAKDLFDITLNMV